LVADGDVVVDGVVVDDVVRDRMVDQGKIGAGEIKEVGGITAPSFTT